MKILINLLFLVLASITWSQGYSVDLMMTTGEKPNPETVEFHFARVPGKYKASIRSYAFYEALIVDSVAGKILNLVEINGIKEAYSYTFQPQSSGKLEQLQLKSFLLDEFLKAGMMEKEHYRLTGDVKLIHGIACKKIEMLNGDKVIGIGWIAEDIVPGMSNRSGLVTPDGAIVEMEMSLGDLVYKLACTNIDLDPSPNSAFSMELPSGYKLMDK